MASASMHLAIAKEYYKMHNTLDYDKYMAGNLYPDTFKNKDESHYTDKNRGKDMVSHLKGKVNLYNFLQEHNIKDSFEFGWFMHLVTDYLFFQECFTEEYLLGHSFDEFRKDLYYGYDCLANHVEEKYNLVLDDYKAYPNERHQGIGYKDCIFTIEMIDKFIERVSSIDMDKYIEKIFENKMNVKPEE